MEQKTKVKFSHSSLATLMNCPMTYYLSKVEGIYPIVEKAAFSIGSAVHWGLERNSYILDDYYKENGKFGQGYTEEQFLAETMVEAYLNKKEQFMKEILRDDETGEQLILLEEEHEVFVTGLLPSTLYNQPNRFIGFIDLRLKTNKGYIIMDYKTSTYEPHWDDYLDQIYRYIFMSETAEPDMPVIKCGIINLRKKQIRQKKNENEQQFKIRFRHEYMADDDNLIVLHLYPKLTLNKKAFNLYVDNLAKMCDTGQLIIDNQAWYINYGNAANSEYKDFFYHIEDAYSKYNISDYIFDLETETINYNRVCRPIDMKVVDRVNCCNHYWKFKKFVDEALEGDIEHSIDEACNSPYFDEVDIKLLQSYVDTYMVEKSLPKFIDIELEEITEVNQK